MLVTKRLLEIVAAMKLATLQLPVVARELTELAQRKSTYRLRCFGVGIPLFVAIIFLTITQAQADSTLDLIGTGATLHQALYITLLCVLYLLAPALSCPAITTEKEKQTLGLLLISRLSPFSLVLEKICSRMIPLMSLVIGSAPLFGIAFLMGGVTVVDTLGAIFCLAFVTFQVTTLGVCASAVMKSSIAAFWVTYITLLTMYFGAQLLAEANLLSRSGPASVSDSWMFLFPPYQFDLLCDQWKFGTTLDMGFDLFWITVPSLLLTASFFVIGWKALVWMGDVGGLTFHGLLLRISPKRWLARIIGQAVRLTSDAGNAASILSKASQALRAQGLEEEVTSYPDLKQNEIWSNYEAAYRPICWRERLAMPLMRTGVLLSVLSMLTVCFFAVWSNTGTADQTEEGATFVLCCLVAGLLVMVSLATRIFARERDQQTMESLLVLPMSNLEILQEKAAPLNGAVLWLVSPIILVTCLSIFLSHTANHHDRDAVFFLCVISHSVLYLHLVKWISIYFGLRMKTNMKAMVASLATIMVLCTAVVAVALTALESFGLHPDEWGGWYFLSPVIVPMVGAFRDLSVLYRGNSMPDSGLLCITLNLGAYFAVMQAAKKWTIKSLPQLLQRRDQDPSFDSGTKYSR